MKNYNKLVIITGVSSGLGNHLANSLLENQYKVVGVYRTLNDSIEELLKKGCLLIKWDLTSINEFDFFVTEIREVLKKSSIDRIIFINNASTIDPIGNIEDFSNSDIIDAINVNITASTLITKFIISLEYQLEIINISSGAADKVISGWGIYCMSKAANKMFYNAIKEQYPRIKVQQIDPGVIDTNMQRRIRLANRVNFPLLDEFVKYYDEGKLQHPKDVALKVIDKIST